MKIEYTAVRVKGRTTNGGRCERARSLHQPRAGRDAGQHEYRYVYAPDMAAAVASGAAWSRKQGRTLSEPRKSQPRTIQTRARVGWLQLPPCRRSQSPNFGLAARSSQEEKSRARHPRKSGAREKIMHGARASEREGVRQTDSAAREKRRWGSVRLHTNQRES